MSEFENQINRSANCLVHNCSIGVTIKCPAYELREALEQGTLEIQRHASYTQRHPDATGCGNFAEDVKLFYDKTGRAVDYDIPYTNPNMVLDFDLVARLVPYDSKPQQLFVSRNNPEEHAGEFETVREEFNDLGRKTEEAQRGFFPPDPIFFEGKPYEVVGETVCQHLECVYNTGIPQGAPIPQQELITLFKERRKIINPEPVD